MRGSRRSHALPEQQPSRCWLQETRRREKLNGSHIPCPVAFGWRHLPE